ncbi:MAG: pyridoxal-dependent decarboxylase, exosortase A system-associated [Pseudomonadota bacterium]
MASAPRRHAALDSVDYRDGVLHWGGVSVEEIVAEAGQTPLYIYSRAMIDQRIAELRNAMPPEMSLHYAIKANPMPDVVRHMLKGVDGLDVASVGELQLALAQGADPAHISFAGPGKSDSELAYAVEHGATVSVESERELARLSAIAVRQRRRAMAVIRVNPSFELKSSGMKMGGLPSQFGIDAERVGSALAQLDEHAIHFRGFHIYAGSQNLRAESLAESLASTVDLVLQLVQDSGRSIEYVNLGGGLGLPYAAGEKPLALADLEAAFHQTTARLQKALDGVAVVLELGRFLVGESGIYVMRVLDTKESRGERFVVTDGGLHHHLAASGNFGQVIRRNYPIAAVRQAAEQREVNVVGRLCTPLDVIASAVNLDQLDVGSLVAVLLSGAYGRSASPAGFLSHPPCLETFV